MTDATPLPDHLPALYPGLEIVDFEDAIVVFDDRSNRAHELKWVSAAVFDACRERVSITSLVDELVAVGVADADESRAIVQRNIESFERNGLTADSVPPPPCIGCGQAPAPSGTRRRVRR